MIHFPRIYIQITEHEFTVRNLDNGKIKTVPLHLVNIGTETKVTNLMQTLKPLIKAIRSTSKIVYFIRPKLILHWISNTPIEDGVLQKLAAQTGARMIYICSDRNITSENLLNSIDWCKNRN